MKQVLIAVFFLSSIYSNAQKSNAKWAYAYTQGFNKCYGSEIFSNVVDISNLTFDFNKTKVPYGKNDLYTFLGKYFQNGFEQKFPNCTALSEIIVIVDCSSVLSSDEYAKRKITSGMPCWLTKEEANDNRATKIRQENGKVLYVDF